MSDVLAIGGKNPSGNAQAIKTDNSGNIGIQIARGKEQISEYSEPVTIQPSEEFILLPKTLNTGFQSIIVNARWAIGNFSKFLIKVNYYNEYDLLIRSDSYSDFNSGLDSASFSLKHPKFEVVIINTSESASELRRFSVVGSIIDSIEDKKVNLLAKNATTGKSVPLSATVDSNGESVLRIVDAAPFAYDPVTNSLRMTITGVPTSSIKDYLGHNALIGSNAMNYGQNALSSSSAVIPLDVSKLKAFSFYVKNNYNQTIAVKVRAFSTSVAGGVLLDSSLIADQSLNAGLGKFYTPSEFPQLKDMVITGLCVTLERGATAPTTGSADLRMYGRVL